MSFLLDTHTWIWSLIDPGRLAPEAVEIIEGGRAELALSPISIWETLMLHEKGRIDLGPDPQRGIAWLLGEYPLREVPVTSAIALRSRLIDLPHQDPADRFLAATSIVHDMPIITRDQHLLASPHVSTIVA